MARGGHGGGMRMGGGGGGSRHGGRGRRVIIRGGGGGGWWGGNWPGYYNTGVNTAQLLALIALLQQRQATPTATAATLQQQIFDLQQQVAMLQGQLVQQAAQPQPVAAPFIAPSDGGGYKG